MRAGRNAFHPTVEVKRCATQEQRKKRLREAINGYDRQGLRGVEFLRQLRLACDEGLLVGLLQEIARQDYLADEVWPAQADASVQQDSAETRTIHALGQDQDCPRTEAVSPPAEFLSRPNPSGFSITPEMIERGQFYLAALDPDYFGYSAGFLVEAIIRVAFALPLDH
jgi:hypothetical protein